MIQWGTVTNTSGSTVFLKQKLPLAYSNTNYKIFLQGKFHKQATSSPVVHGTNVTVQTFEYFWADNTNNLNYLTVGY